jgi:nitroreductase
MALPSPLPQTPLLHGRFSARKFTDAAVSEQTLHSLLEAARWAPSSRNEQPWAFIVAPRQDTVAFEALLGCLAENNQAWAKEAAVLMLCATAARWSDRDLPNRHAWHDVGLAVMSLSVQAVSLGLQAREMGGLDYDKARALYQVPASHDITSALAVGMPAEAGTYLSQRSRKPLESFVFEGSWGKPWKA